ncbi:MAG: PD-(D/E)XK nuclease family protein, partial [Clostridia bacterium]
MIKIIRSNTTKAEIEHLKSEVCENEGLNLSDIVICEDRFTLSLEQEILSAKKNNGSFSLNVYSFSRLLQNLMKNQPPKNYLTKTGSIMMISKILQDSSNELVCYRQLAKSYSSLSQSVYDVLAQLKSSKVTCDDLATAKPTSAALSMKTADLSLIYKKYEEFKANVLLDSADKLDLLSELIVQSDLISQSNIHIIGFTSFTKQLYSVIGNLFFKAKNVTVYVLDGQNDVYDKSVLKNLENMLKDLSLNYSCEFANEKLPSTRQAISQYLFSFTSNSKMQKTETDDVVLYQGANLVNELKFVAEKILYEVRFNNRSFSDIAVVGSNLNENHDIIARALGAYDIPCFLDDKVKLSEHIFTRIIVAMFDIALNGFETQSVLTILHSPFFEIPSEDKLDFENYIVAKGVSRNNFTKDFPFKDEKMRGIRDKFIAEFSLSAVALSDVSEYSKLTLSLVERFSTKIQELSDNFKSVGEFEHAAITLQAKEKFTQTINEMDQILKNTVLSLEDYVRILLDGLSSCEISIAPLYTDSVFIGDFSSSKFTQKKVLFAINVNNRLVPLLKSDMGLITDRDIDSLVPCNISLEPKIQMVNDIERLNVFLALLNFSDKLYLTFSNYAMNFDVLSPSEIISTFSNMFEKNSQPLVPVTIPAVDFDNENDLNSYVENTILTTSLALNKLAESVSLVKTGDNKRSLLAATLFSTLKSSEKNTIANLIVEEKPPIVAENAFNDKVLYSVSNLESYFACPYKNFVKNALFARERDEGFIKAVDSGNYIHEALELFVGEVPKLNKDSYV